MARPKMAVGTWAWVFGPYAKNPTPLADVLRAVKEIGYDGVELTGKPHAHPDDLSTPAARAAFRKLFEDSGLEIASLGGPVGGGSPFQVEHSAWTEKSKRYVDLCAATGINALRVSSGRVAPENPLASDQPGSFQRLIDYWGEIADLASTAGQRILWEFEPNQFASRPQDIVRVTDGIGRRSFGVMFDLSHAYLVSVAGKAQPAPSEPLAGGLAGFARLLGSRVGRLHLADTNGETMANGGSKRCRLGEGSVDFHAALNALRDARGGQIGDGWWTLDLHGEEDATAVARESKAFMDRMASAEG